MVMDLKELKGRFLSHPPIIPFHSKPSQSQHQQAHPPPSPHAPPVNAVYYPNYRVYRGDTPASMNYDYISHVFYAFANVTPEGDIVLSDEWADLQMNVDGHKGCLRSFHAIRQQRPHLKLILSIGGGAASQNFASVAANPSLRNNFARSARLIVESHQLDGIDILPVDWEHPSTPQQGQDFIALLAAINTQLPDTRYLLTAALPAGRWALQNIELGKAQHYLHFINLMAYDFTGSWTEKAGHHAQLFSKNSESASGAAAIDYLLQMGVESHKILLGIPVYGRSFLGCKKVGDRHAGHGGEEGTFEYKELPKAGAVSHTHNDAVAACCVGNDDAGGFISYDTPETVGMKGGYVREKRLGGLFYWTGTADKQGPESLVAAGYRALHT